VSVGEIFEAMTQVDHDLTLIHKFDWQLRLIKNLGHHKHASKCEELDVLRVELVELQSRPTLLGACTSFPGLHEKLAELRSHIISLEANFKAPISTCELHAVKNL
jgi:hypothetical protein